MCGGDGQGAGNDEIVWLLRQLVTKSLVVADPDTRGGMRYRLLEPLRDFAAALLRDSYVIVGADAGSKADKAARLGVPNLSEQDFEALVAAGCRPTAKAERAGKRGPSDLLAGEVSVQYGPAGAGRVAIARQEHGPPR